MRTFKQLFCTHKASITRRVDGRLFTQCLRCALKSEGIKTGGFKYDAEVYARIERSKSAVAGL